MFKKVIAAVFLSLLVLLSSVSNQALAKVERSIISVAGDAFEYHSPDTAKITLAVETKNKNLSSATTINNQKVSTILSQLKPMLDFSRGDKVKTTSYTVRPYKEYDRKAKKYRDKGYIVENRVVVSSKDINSVGKLINVGLANGANKVHGLDFSIEDPSKYCNSVLTKAVQKAKSEASVVASALGVKLYGIKRVSSSCNTSSFDRPMPLRMESFAMGASAKNSAPPIEAGEMKIYGAVEVEFYISN